MAQLELDSGQGIESQIGIRTELRCRSQGERSGILQVTFRDQPQPGQIVEGVRVVRFTNRQVQRQIEAVLEAILDACQER